MTISTLPRILIEPIIRNALLEDLGLAGDITTNSVVDENQHSKVAMISRENGILSGAEIAALSFILIDPTIKIKFLKNDGDSLSPGDKIAIIEGSSHAILTGERTALNFMSHLSGIASVTHKIVKAIAGTKAHVVCTRKTTPGLRLMEKYAVRCGGGMNHRFALYDAVLIKDNHIAIVGGVRKALEKAKRKVGHMVKIEIEIDTLEQLKEVLSIGVDAVLLDNMTTAMLKEAVAMIDHQAITEASGRITLDTARTVAESGVDLISVGWITHSAPILDIGLDFLA